MAATDPKMGGRNEIRTTFCESLIGHNKSIIHGQKLTGSEAFLLLLRGLWRSAQYAWMRVPGWSGLTARGIYVMNVVGKREKEIGGNPKT
jgi:hypothetical protein